MNKKLFEQYANAKLLHHKIGKELEEMKAQIIEEMQNEGVEEVDADYGSFTLYPKREWTFPEELKEKEQELKEEKLKAKQTGEAEYEEQMVLRFSPANTADSTSTAESPAEQTE